VIMTHILQGWILCRYSKSCFWCMFIAEFTRRL